MASNASTRLNELHSDNSVRSETVDSDMADRIVGAIKGGIRGGLSGWLLGTAVGAAAVTTGPLGLAVGWFVGVSTTFFGAAQGAARGFITKGY